MRSLVVGNWDEPQALELKKVESVFGLKLHGLEAPVLRVAKLSAGIIEFEAEHGQEEDESDDAAFEEEEAEEEDSEGELRDSEEEQGSENAEDDGESKDENSCI